MEEENVIMNRKYFVDEYFKYYKLRGKFVWKIQFQPHESRLLESDIKEINDKLEEIVKIIEENDSLHGKENW